MALSKAIGTYYSATAQPNVPPNRMLRAAFAIALLLQLRMEEVEMRGGISLRPLQATDNLAIEADFVGNPRAIDELALAAFAGYLCALTKTRLTLTFTGHGSYTISGYGKFADVLRRYRDAFSAIALWGDFEFTFSSKEVKVTQR